MRPGLVAGLLAGLVTAACSPHDFGTRSTLARVEHRYYVGDQPTADGMGPVVMSLEPADRDCAEARHWSYRYPDDHFAGYGYAIRDGRGRAANFCPPLTAMRPLPQAAPHLSGQELLALHAARAARADERMREDRLFELDDLLARGRIDADYHARRRAQLLSGDF